MTTNILIADCSTSTSVTITDGVMTVNHSGGCPVESILRPISQIANSADIAREVLRMWLDGYDGCAMCSGVNVTVEREASGDDPGEIATEETCEHSDGCETIVADVEVDDRDPRHSHDCICADCAGAVLTSDND